MEFFKATVLCSFLFSFSMATLNPGQFPAIYNFGDSNSDTGAMSAAFFPEKSPFGITYFKRPSGRTCDGRLLIDFIAEKLNYPLLSPYLDSIGTNFRRGANFATDGALVRRILESFYVRHLSPFDLEMQVSQYANFKDRCAFYYQQGRDVNKLPVPAEFGNALHIIDIGQNDIAFGFAAKQSDQQVIASFPDIINHIASNVEQLYQLGARNFWILNTGPIGCLPMTTQTLKDPPSGTFDPSGCIKSQNIVALKFNQQLKAKVIELRGQLAQSKLTYIDIYTAKYEMIMKATSLGFMKASTICCGYYDPVVQIACGTTATINGTELFAGACKDPLKVISWDGVHYSEASNAYVANKIFTDPKISDPPV